jgi:RimJ/RimL family protein N-acetyltransferase
MFDAVPTLRGEHVTLRPLEVADARALFEVTPRGTFRLFLSWPTEWTAAAFEAWVKAKLFGPKQRAMVVTLTRTGEVVGSTSFLDIDPVNKAVEVGSTWYAPSVRGTAVNPESKLLMLGYAFEVEGCERVTLKTDARNEHSKRAMAKMGAVYEGVLRKHRIQQDGFVRDTAYFSVVRDEWAGVKAGLRKRLDEDRQSGRGSGSWQLAR